jgi:myo-inositol 2-dehydrogenase/D-chiro-inositol 1-dehydrogenase
MTVAVALIGAGRMGSFHAETLAHRIPGARLAAIADPGPGAAARLAERYGCPAVTDVATVLADPAIDAVVIATPARTHTDLIVAAAATGKAIFCEKPMAITLPDADRAIAAADQAGVRLQIGFNRRYDKGFQAGHDALASLGTPYLMRSITRDPKLADPARIPPWTIFLETLIHDFDVLRWLNPGAEAVEVFAMADALVRPDFRDRGLLDTAVVTIRFDNGAIATAEANFQAVYGYDVRAEVHAANGMTTMGTLRRTPTTYTPNGLTTPCPQTDQDLFHDAYTSELTAFITKTTPTPTGPDARAALAIAHAAITSVKTHAPVPV